ncbi:LuxR C-terminal-related transcriptional regulator [Streptomyces thinghirensis]|nr:LuxR C-terminal-related transcriptional regulator [Streptomyces thinghirensis]
MAQLATGRGNREIARALFISEATVKTICAASTTSSASTPRAGAVAVAEGGACCP